MRGEVVVVVPGTLTCQGDVVYVVVRAARPVLQRDPGGTVHPYMRPN